MSHWKSCGFVFFAMVCLVGETAGSAHAQIYATEWSGGSIINLGGLSGSVGSEALSINGEAVGASFFSGSAIATEWSGGVGGSIINLGGLPGFTNSQANDINDAGQVVGGAAATLSNGAAAALSTWETCRALQVALRSGSTRPDRWWDGA
jgi:uncharacterized membrane protein